MLSPSFESVLSVLLFANPRTIKLINSTVYLILLVSAKAPLLQFKTEYLEGTAVSSEEEGISTGRRNSKQNTWTSIAVSQNSVQRRS